MTKIQSIISISVDHPKKYKKFKNIKNEKTIIGYVRPGHTSKIFRTLAAARQPVATAGWEGPWADSRISWERTKYR